MTAEVPLYDALGADYDRFVNWEARLAHELPFFERLFAEHGVRRVLDAACGTGHHTIALARRGYQTSGADLSAEMIAQARRNAATARVSLEFAAVGFGELAPTLGRDFDAALCLGNSLPHLLSAQAVAAALTDMAATLRPGGLLVVQNRNYDRVWQRRERFMPPTIHGRGDEEILFFRFMDFHAETMAFNMARFWRSGDGWDFRVDATELRPIFRDELEMALKTAGFQNITFYGDYAAAPFDAGHSGDLIAVAQRR
ncbi:MAG: class I SAM-dependent methyltransferase [Chloroflexota bacterium]